MKKSALLLLLSAALLSACASRPVSAEEPAASELPAWLNTRIAEYNARPPAHSPSEILRGEFAGKPVYLVVQPCCDQFNPLYDAAGTVICAPSGGFTGQGDGKCPAGLSRSARFETIWTHPQLRRQPKTERVPPKPQPPALSTQTGLTPARSTA